jgi:8-amino-7-oxononanoate synthase
MVEIDRALLRRQLVHFDQRNATRVSTSGRPLLNFASNDYLGLAQHPALREAAIMALEDFGAGSAASRLVCGSIAPHQQLERALAEFKTVEDALAFSSGYATALGTLPALAGPADFVILDRLAHACLVDAARLSRAKIRVFRHNDLDDLRRLLNWAREARSTSSPDASMIIVVTESIFSMDGDRAPLRQLVELKDEFGAALFLDEAHATGWLGPGRRGLAEAEGVADRIDVPMGTLGKALGVAGGYITGSKTLCDFLLHRARSFMFSTAPPPAQAAAACAALRIAASTEGATLARHLWTRVIELHRGLGEIGWELPPPASPILPLIVGSEIHALELARALRDEGVLVPAIRFPTVAHGKARLRLTATASHTPDDVAFFLAALRRVVDRTGIRPPRMCRPATA